MLPSSEALKWKHAYFQLFNGTSIERAMAPLVMGQGQFKTIQTQGQTSGNTGIMVIKEHKICVAPLRPYNGSMLIFTFLSVPL